MIPDRPRLRTRPLLPVLALALVALPVPGAPTPAAAQEEHVHTPGMQHPSSGDATPEETGQAAFAALQEVVRILEADPDTDWSRVDLERLRQHLVDMDEVTLRSRVAATEVEGGAVFEVTGEGRTVDAVRRVARAHGGMLAAETPFRWETEEIPAGVRVTATAASGAPPETVDRIRGLGFVGLLVQGDHHGPHHLALARGDVPHGHGGP